MVTLITEKLRNQHLDDIQFEPILQSSRWPVRELSGQGVSGFAPHSKSTKGNECLAFTGQDSTRERTCFHGNTPATNCLHGYCNNNTAPPKKRHCRSLSIPGDSRASWQPQASSVWRPVSAGRTRSRANRNSPCSKIRPVMSPMTAPLSPSDVQITPPDTPSPVPRPASASSGFYDSSQGSLYTPWLDSCSSPGPPKLRHASGGAILCNSQDMTSEAGLPPVSSELYKSRIYSMDESDSAKHLPSSKNAISMPTLPHVAPSNPSSPWRHRVPRCRSQPCVLYERKSGLKRRRDDDRPTLDFRKMKETALETEEHASRTGRSHSFTCATRQRNVQFAPIETVRPRTKNQFTDPPECFLGLNTIASSPLDNPALPPHMSQPSIQSASSNTSMAIASVTIATDSVKDDFSDSGCSESNEECGDSTGFVDAERSCGCDDHDDKDVEQFDLEMPRDLDIDLDQIEQD